MTSAVVVGSGALGASAAWHLARQGVQVTLVERGAPVSGSSARAAGLGLQIPPDDILGAVCMAARAKLLGFEAETGVALTVHESGSLKLARTEADAVLLHDEFERGLRAGVEVELVDADRARGLAPWFEPGDAAALWYAPGDVYLEPGELPNAYLTALRRTDAVLRFGTAITGLRRDGAGRIVGVRTTDGDLDADHVVLAAGAWNQPLAGLAGVTLPLWPVRHELCVTAPHASIDLTQPAVRVIDARTYIRPYRGGLMFGGYEPEPTPVDLAGAPAGFSIEDVDLDARPLHELAGLIAAEFPLLQGLDWTEVRGGLPTMTPDGHFLAGPVPAADGLWVLGGCNVAGLSTSPVLGEDLAAYIATGHCPARIAAFSVDRFGPELHGLDTLRDACMATYAHKYSALETRA